MNADKPFHIQVERAINHRGSLLFVPCLYGDAMSPFYEIPLNAFHADGLSVIRYNPRGHGGSREIFDVPLAVGDFIEWWSEQTDLGGDLYAVGHSIGCQVVSRIGEAIGPFKSLMMVSPAVSSKSHLIYMLEEGHFGEFYGMFRPEDGARLYALMNGVDWYRPEVWRRNDFAKKLDFPVHLRSGGVIGSVGRTLANIYQTDHRLDPFAIVGRSQLRVKLSPHDNWISNRYTEAFFRECGIVPSYVMASTSHFHGRCWSAIWQEFRIMIRSIPVSPKSERASASLERHSQIPNAPLR